MGGVGTRGSRDLDGGPDGHMKRIFRRARYLPAAVLCLLAAPALAEATGRAAAVDGDTPLRSAAIRGQRIRLHGIDAPETGQTCRRGGAPWDCGRAAAELLHELTAGTLVGRRPPVREGGVGRQAPPSYLKETLIFAR